MVCIECHRKPTQVVNSRPRQFGMQVWRRRYCPECHSLFSTYEQLSPKDMPAVKTGHSSARFSIPKLCISILTELEPNQDNPDTAYELAVTTWQKLSRDCSGSLTRQDIVQITYNTLYAYQPSAGLRYGLKHQLLSLTAARRRTRHQ